MALVDLYKERNLGMDEMDESTGVPILCISQALSEVTTEGLMAAGHFYDTKRKEDLGTSLDVIPLAFMKMWFEWKPNQGGLVGRWKPNSIPVTGDPFNGGMFHGENKVVDTFVYAFLIATDIEFGPILYTSSPGNIKYLKTWNQKMKSLKLPDTQTTAPMYAGIWNLTISKSLSQSGRPFYAFGSDGKSSIKFVRFVEEEVAKNNVLPLIDQQPPLIQLSNQLPENTLF